jgi:hypothetical protein
MEALMGEHELERIRYAYLALLRLQPENRLGDGRLQSALAHLRDKIAQVENRDPNEVQDEYELRAAAGDEGDYQELVDQMQRYSGAIYGKSDLKVGLAGCGHLIIEATAAIKELRARRLRRSTAQLERSPS